METSAVFQGLFLQEEHFSCKYILFYERLLERLRVVCIPDVQAFGEPVRHFRKKKK
jgi:hypothetical protein